MLHFFKIRLYASIILMILDSTNGIGNETEVSEYDPLVAQSGFDMGGRLIEDGVCINKNYDSFEAAEKNHGYIIR